jgi:alkyldihydroxyacetonephosphate synthase
VALRTGRIDAFPDGVAFPGTEGEVADLLSYARRVGARVIPRRGGSSVVGGVNPQQGDKPVLAVSLEPTFRTYKRVQSELFVAACNSFLQL